MGRINKSFTVRAGGVQVRSVGKVDSGADVSLVRLDIGRRLGIDPATSDVIAVGGIGNQRTVGFSLPATIEIDGSEAKLDLAVPVGTVDARGHLTTFEQKNNLIGHDFLQATGARLDFSEGRGRFVAGKCTQRVDDVELLKITPREERALRAWMIRNLSPRRKRKTRMTRKRSG